MERSNVPESYKLSGENAPRYSAPDAYRFIALHGYPRHVNGVIAALRDAVFLASAGLGAWQQGNPSFDFEALDAAHLDASAASGASVRFHYRYPFLLHSCALPSPVSP